jgi:hypothetical protein
MSLFAPISWANSHDSRKVGNKLQHQWPAGSGYVWSGPGHAGRILKDPAKQIIPHRGTFRLQFHGLSNPE